MSSSAVHRPAGVSRVYTDGESAQGDLGGKGRKIKTAERVQLQGGGGVEERFGDSWRFESAGPYAETIFHVTILLGVLRFRGKCTIRLFRFCALVSAQECPEACSGLRVRDVLVFCQRVRS